MSSVRIQGLQQGWEKLLSRVDRLSKRERIQMVVLMLVLLGAGWMQGALEPYRKEQVAIHKQRTQLDKGIGDLMTLEQEILIRKEKNPDQLAEERIAALRAEIQDLDKRLGEGVMGMISPSEMVQALKRLLTSESGLALLSLEVPPPRNLLVGDDAGGSVYQHTLVLRFSGSFEDVLHYLFTLERLPWKIFWDGLEFAVVEYPKAYVTLHIHTLSLTEDLVGGPGKR
ncbi:MAG: hypothetical protein G8237_15040 [Magnetococcales bacterium]|nr:hypothetical protein [Magnetococcales bacterium]